MNVDHLKILFQELGIKNVAIVDDAYLEHPTLADLKSIDGIKALWAGIDASDEALDFLGGREVSLNAPEDIDESQLENLYKLRPDSSALSAILSQFDEIQVHKRE